MNQVLMSAIHDSWLGEAVRGSAWAFVTLETLHFIGLCVLIGALLVVDLRLVGFYRQMPVREVLKYTPWAIVGFLVNLASGVGFVASDPFNYLNNPAFWLKMALIGVAGANVAWFELVERRRLAALGPNEEPEFSARAAAVLSLGLWVAVITAGRLLPQFGSGG